MPPTRASRRVAARRKPVVETSSESEPEPASEREEPEKEDTPPLARRRQSKRPVASAATPASASRANRATRNRTLSIEVEAGLPRNRKKRTPPTPARNTRVKRLAGSPPDEDEEGGEQGTAAEEQGTAAEEQGTAAEENGVSTKASTPRASVVPSSVAATPNRDAAVSTATSTPRASVRPPSAQPSTPVAQTPAEAPTTPSRPIPTPSKTTPRTEVLMDTASQTQTQRPQSSSSSQRPQSSSSQNEPRNYEPIVVKSRANALLQASQDPVIPKQRLVITHLVMENFKSYAGKQLVGPFHASFSSVVGPNGSGKSNVIDSLLFVFGFRASKMRQGKISALIHNSAAHPDLNFCEVQVHFHEVLDLPGGCHEVIPNSKLVVTRRAFKTNSSTYFISGRKSDYTEVTALLRGRGIDLDHKRFLILQGEVESIAQMKPKAQNKDDDGLLEYLEDIIGTSRYKQPIEESANQAEELNEVCVEKSNRVQHVEKEKNNLEDKKNAALEYILTENEIVRMKSTLFQTLAMEADNNVKVTSGMIIQLQAELDGELENHRGSEDGIKKLQKKYTRESKEIEEIEKDTQAILRETARAEKEAVKFQEKEKFVGQKQKKLQKTIQTNKLSASEAKNMVERHTSDAERYGGEAVELTENLKVAEAELEKIRDALKEKTQGFSDEIAKKQKTLEPWVEKVNQKQSAIAVAQSELDILHAKSNESKVALEEAQAKIGQIEEARTTKQEELKECQKEEASLKKEARKVQAELEKMNQREPQLRNNVSGARQKADEAKFSLAASQTQGAVLTNLMRLQETGRIEGFHGRLGGLGAIDVKYDVAISTACPQLENMVVDSVPVAQQCIDHLRKNNLGRATFLCLDKLQQAPVGRIKTPENAPRLFDLIKPKNPDYLPAFWKVLGNTLVADDLEQADRIAYGAERWRVVTLGGELIEKAGTMTGGGNSVSKGRMSSKIAPQVSKDALQKLEQERDRKEESYAEFQEQQRGLESNLHDINERIPELEITISKIQLEIEASVRGIVDAERRIQELSKEKGTSTQDKNRIAALTKHIKGLEKEIEQLQAETEDIKEEIQALQDKIMEVGGMKLRSQKAQVDGIREQVETLNEQISGADLAKTKAEKQIAKAEKVIASSEKELTGNETELEKLRENMKESERNSHESKKKAEEAQDYLEKRKDALASLKEELDEKQDELNKTRAAEIEMKNNLEMQHKTLSEQQRKTKAAQEELSKLKLQDVKELTGERTEQGEEDDILSTELQIHSADELADVNKGALRQMIGKKEGELEGISIDLSVLSEYRRRVEEHTARSSDLQESVSSRDTVKHRLDDLRKRRMDEFMEGFRTISLRLKEMYQMITMGGNAELELVDSLDPFSEGIIFSVMPPKKSWKNISNLSGGEKTLSSLALVFALHHYKPTPLYVMDEIDAALDFRNVSIVASYIKERTKNAQFIVISLRNNMFELAARLVGVYKVNHMTKSVTIENKPYITVNGGA